MVAGSPFQVDSFCPTKLESSEPMTLGAQILTRVVRATGGSIAGGYSVVHLGPSDFKASPEGCLWRLPCMVFSGASDRLGRDR